LFFIFNFASLKHKLMKNVFSVLMAGVMLFSVACGGGEEAVTEEAATTEEVGAEEPAAPVDSAAAPVDSAAAAAPAQ
jgi:energy-converting hydrogenase Eha subunit F